MKEYLDKIAYQAPSDIPEDDGISYLSREDNSYIGRVGVSENDGLIKFIEEKGITKLQSPIGKVACIGFCPTEDKWYGWSHRAIYGFGVGDTVSKGDCGYIPFDREDARSDAVSFWSGEGKCEVTAADSKDKEGRFYFDVKWKYTEDIPNTKLRGTISGVSHYAPDKYGKGAWSAKTMADAKQMACDFAEGVS